MKKFIFMSSLCAAMTLVCGCGGGESKSAETSVPVEEESVWCVEKTVTVNNELRGKEVTHFGAADQVVSVDRYTVDKETGVTFLEEHLIYQNGRPVYTNVQDEKANVIGHNIYAYNEAGNITQQTVETYVEGLKKVAPSQRFVYTYNENGDVTSVKDQHTIYNGWGTDYEWTYQYDEQNRLILRADYKGDGKERKQSCQFGYTYKKDCNQLEQVDYFFYDVNSSKLRHDSKHHYEYDKKGLLKTETVLRHKANKTRDYINSRCFCYTYNSNNQVTTCNEQKWNNAEKKWVEVKSVMYQYSPDGQLLQSYESYFTKKGLKVNKEVYTPVPEGKSLVAPAAVKDPVKPVVDLDDKHKTSKADD